MIKKRIDIFVLVAFISGIAFGGNESGGGVPPPPVFMPEAATYECSLELNQLNNTLNQGFVSRGSATFSWEKGEYGGRRGIDLKDVQNWKHYTLRRGPFRPILEEVPNAPTAATFGGFVTLDVNFGASEEGEEVVGRNLNVRLTTLVSSVNNLIQSGAESYRIESLQSRKDLKSNAKYSAETPEGEIIDQRTLNVTCKRTR